MTTSCHRAIRPVTSGIWTDRPLPPLCSGGAMRTAPPSCSWSSDQGALFHQLAQSRHTYLERSAQSHGDRLYDTFVFQKVAKGGRQVLLGVLVGVEAEHDVASPDR